MSRKHWYVCIENQKPWISKSIVQYCKTKQDAEKLLKELKKQDNNKRLYPYIDFMWKEDIKNVPFNSLHGKNVLSVNNILSYVS